MELCALELHTLGDLGRAVAGLNQDIASLGAECGRDSLCESLNTCDAH